MKLGMYVSYIVKKIPKTARLPQSLQYIFLATTKLLFQSLSAQLNFFSSPQNISV